MTEKLRKIVKENKELIKELLEELEPSDVGEDVSEEQLSRFCCAPKYKKIRSEALEANR